MPRIEIKRLVFLIAAIGLLGSWGFSQTTSTVRPSNLVPFSDPVTGWRFGAEGAAPASFGGFTLGPGQAPLGGGSAEFGLLDLTGGMSLQFFSPELQGFPLAALTRLEYCTFVSHSEDSEAVSLQFNFDEDITDGDDGYKGRLIYEPRNTPGNNVLENQWQCWNALEGNWWATGAPLNRFHSRENPGSFAEILSLYPDAGFNTTFAGLILKASSGRGSFQGYADAVTVGLNYWNLTFDFEQEPVHLDDCKQGGWSNFAFSSEGQCLKFVIDRDGGSAPISLFLPPAAALGNEP